MPGRPGGIEARGRLVCRVRYLRIIQSRKAFGITARDRLAPRRTGKNGAELMSVAHDLYLDLMMRCLTDWIYDGANEGRGLRDATGRRGAHHDRPEATC